MRYKIAFWVSASLNLMAAYFLFIFITNPLVETHTEMKIETPPTVTIYPSPVSSASPVKERFPVVIKPKVSEILLVVHPDSPISEINTEQLNRVLSGSCCNWNQLGGQDEPLTIYTNGKPHIPNAKKLQFLSLLLPTINSNRQSLGVCMNLTPEQMDFLTRHSGVKVLHIKGG